MSFSQCRFHAIVTKSTRRGTPSRQRPVIVFVFTSNGQGSYLLVTQAATFHPSGASIAPSGALRRQTSPSYNLSAAADLPATYALSNRPLKQPLAISISSSSHSTSRIREFDSWGLRDRSSRSEPRHFLSIPRSERSNGRHRRTQPDGPRRAAACAQQESHNPQCSLTKPPQNGISAD
jgi:hypothetical protein